MDWSTRFKVLDRRFLERVLVVWPRCVARLPPDAVEEQITVSLVDLLTGDREASRLFHYLEYEFHPFDHTDDGAPRSKGRIDMALVVDKSRRRYLAYECKRLNEVRDGVTRSLATDYVLQGVRRFSTGQYSEGLPVGCMMGYVMDGNTASARTRVGKAIGRHKDEIGLIAAPGDLAPIGQATRFSSRHERASADGEVELRHSLLPFKAT